VSELGDQRARYRGTPIGRHALRHQLDLRGHSSMPRLRAAPKPNRPATRGSSARAAILAARVVRCATSEPALSRGSSVSCDEPQRGTQRCVSDSTCSDWPALGAAERGCRETRFSHAGQLRPSRQRSRVTWLKPGPTCPGITRITCLAQGTVGAERIAQRDASDLRWVEGATKSRRARRRLHPARAAALAPEES
jgi:hypothetical protein